MAAAARNPTSLWSTGFSINVAVLLAAWLALAWLAYAASEASGLKAYDPYEILQIQPGATVRQIRSAYRELSLRYHPDKPSGDEKMFMSVAKAYEALTDPVAKENYEKFGNPDGRQALQVAVALPSFMLDSENHVALLLVYLAVLVVVLPLGYMYFLRPTGQPDVPRQETMVWMVQRMMNDLGLPHFAALYGGAAELAGQPVLEPELEWMKKLELEVAKRAKQHDWEFRGVPVPQPQFPKEAHMVTVHPQAVRKHALLLTAHQLDIDLHELLGEEAGEAAASQQDFVLSKANLILRAMREAALLGPTLMPLVLPLNEQGKRLRQQELQHLQQQRAPKLQSPAAFHRIVTWTQMLLQARLAALSTMPPWMEPLHRKDAWVQLMQLQGFTASAAKSAMLDRRGPNSLLQWLNTPIPVRPGLDALDQDAKREVLQVARSIPNLHVQAWMGVAGVQNMKTDDGCIVVYVGDMLSCRVKATHLNMLPEFQASPLYNPDAEPSSMFKSPSEVPSLKLGDDMDEHGNLTWSMDKENKPSAWEDEPCMPVHAPLWPEEVDEKWYISLHSQEGFMFGYDVVNGTRVMRKTMPLMAPRQPGVYLFTLSLQCNGYMGVDVALNFKLRVVPPPEDAEEELDEEDAELLRMANAPVSVEALLGANKAELVDDSDSEGEEEAAKAAPAPAAAAAGSGASPVSMADLSDADSDDGHVVGAARASASEESPAAELTEEEQIAAAAAQAGLSVSEYKKKLKRQQRKSTGK